MKIIKTFSCLLLCAILVLTSMTFMFAVADNTGTVTISNIMPGAIYTLYKVFDASPDAAGTAYAYTLNTNSDTAATSLAAAIPDSDVNSCPFYKAESTVSGVYNIYMSTGATAESIATWLTARTACLSKPVQTDPRTNPYTGTGTETNGEYTFEDLASGYYLVVSYYGSGDNQSAVTLTNLAQSSTIIDKYTRTPSGLDKSAKSSAEIGEEVTFTIAFNAVNFLTENSKSYRITEYVLDDTMTNFDSLTAVTDATKLKNTVFGDEDGTVQIYSDSTKKNLIAPLEGKAVSYTTTYTAASGSDPAKMTLTVNWGTAATEATGGTSSYPENTYVVITYKMKMASGTYNPAGTGSASFEDAVNTVSGNIRINKSETDTIDELKNFGTDTVTVKTTGISITKVDATDSTTQLTGAKFKLYKKVKDETDPTKTIIEYWQSGTNNNITWTTDSAQATEVLADNLDTTVEFFGLGAGEYYLTETYAPNGYYLPTDDFKIVINATDATSGAGTEITATLTVDSNPVNITADANGIIAAVISNAKGILLPVTGGIGTTVFYIAGGVIFVAAIVLLITKKRMNGR